MDSNLKTVTFVTEYSSTMSSTVIVTIILAFGGKCMQAKTFLTIAKQIRYHPRKLN